MKRAHKASPEGIGYKLSFGEKAFDVCNIIFMLFMSFIMLYPLYYIIVVSVNDGLPVMRNEVYWYPIGLNFEVYKSILHYDYFLNSYWNTIVITALGTVTKLICHTLAAYPLSRSRLYGKNILTFFFTFTMFFSGGLIPSYLNVVELGLRNSIWALIIPSLCGVYNIVIMRTFFQRLPEELWESAYLDGANDFQVLVRIIIPLSGALYATMTLFFAVGHWNDWFSALIYLDDKAKQPVQLFLRAVVLQGSDSDMLSAAAGTQSDTGMVVSQNYKYAAIIITLLPILCVYPFVQKYFVKGMLVGSLKG